MGSRHLLLRERPLEWLFGTCINPLIVAQAAAYPRQRKATQIRLGQVGATQVQRPPSSTVWFLFFLGPEYRPTPVLVGYEQPLHVCPRQLDRALLIAEGVDALLDIWLDGPSLSQELLAHRVN